MNLDFNLSILEKKVMRHDINDDNRFIDNNVLMISRSSYSVSVLVRVRMFHPHLKQQEIHQKNLPHHVLAAPNVVQYMFELSKYSIHCWPVMALQSFWLMIFYFQFRK